MEPHSSIEEKPVRTRSPKRCPYASRVHNPEISHHSVKLYVRVAILHDVGRNTSESKGHFQASHS